MVYLAPRLVLSGFFLNSTILPCYNDAMNKKYSFRATIENAGGGGAFVRIPFDVEQAFGKKRVPIVADIAGHIYRGTLMRMGEPCHILGILKEIRIATGRDIGDEIEITLSEDTQPRRVEIPPALQEALAQDPQAKAAFGKLSYTHQKEHVRFILEAKREQTRRDRINKTISNLKVEN